MPGMNEDDKLQVLAQEDNFLYFNKGEFPCLFMIQVKEGFARFEVKDANSLQILLEYSKGKSLQVEWVQAVINDEFHTREYATFPGGKFVAHLLGNDVFQQGEILES